MPETFSFELVSPEKLLVSKDAVMVVVPGGEGAYGVLAGHAPMITTVKAGFIDIYGNDDKTITERIFVTGGFAEVSHARCTVLAEEAVSVADVERPNLEAIIRELSEKIGEETSDVYRTELAQLTVAQAKLQNVSH